MVFLTPKPKRVLAACCKVEVIKGAEGLLFVGLSSRLVTTKLAFSRRATCSADCSLVAGRYSFPWYLTASNLITSFAGVANKASSSQNSSGTNARISFSRSTINLTATDCTRPADKPRATLAQSKGDTMKPTTRSRNRRACWALTRFISSSDGVSKADLMAFLVISLKTTRL